MSYRIDFGVNAYDDATLPYQALGFSEIGWDTGLVSIDESEIKWLLRGQS
jgi:hypothetical protein